MDPIERIGSEDLGEVTSVYAIRGISGRTPHDRQERERKRRPPRDEALPDGHPDADGHVDVSV